MKVVCINVDDLFSAGIKIGEIYEVRKKEIIFFTPSHKKGVEIVKIDRESRYRINGVNYYTNRFITLDEWRNNQIDKIIK